MIDGFYQFLAELGYSHPLHPPLTHLPLGMVLGAFIFASISILKKGSALALTARHCTALALFGLFPTVLMGYMDWQHYYQGAMLFEIKAKIALAATLFVLLVLAVLVGGKSVGAKPGALGIYALCAIAVAALGYFGGELVFRGKPPAGETLPPLAREGEAIFRQSCTGCHFTDSTETKFGPGLKGLFTRDTLASSGQPLDVDSVRRQIVAPFKMMPPFPSLTPQQMDALIAYLKSL